MTTKEEKAREYCYFEHHPTGHYTIDQIEEIKEYAYLQGYEDSEKKSRERAVKAFDHLNLFEFTTVECEGDFDRIYEETREQFLKYYNNE